jgi:hypothetical protein
LAWRVDWEIEEFFPVICFVCTRKADPGDDFGFARKNCLFLNQDSLFRQNNSLFC